MNILFVSLGCDKNLVDSEVMLGLVREAGYNITNDEQEADIIVVNSCCFIHDAKEESITTILEMAQLKKKAKLKALIVTGCLAQRYKNEILQEIPEVDAVLGSTSYDAIVKTIEDTLEGQKVQLYKDINYLPTELTERVVTTGNAMAYLKIAEGCDKHCTYCVIPSIRGNFRSVPMKDLLATAHMLAKDGVKELVLVAQETTLYGVDQNDELKKQLPELLHQLGKIEGIEWIRLLYCYPEEITDELIETIAREPKVCHYLDMPIQHGQDSILKRMGRRTNQAELKKVIGKLRKAIPDIVLRTTLITGFPGETPEDHQALLNFIDEMEFDHLGAFTYSAEEDTPAAKFPDQIPQSVMNERKDEIMSLQQEISYDKNIAMIGKCVKVLIEGYLFEDNVYLGRSYRDAPNVDGYVFVTAKEELVSGDMIMVRITDANEYDLIGEVEYEFTK